MKIMQLEKLVPHPVLSASLFVIWLLLVNSMAVGQFLLAALFAIGVPLITHRFWPERTPLHRPRLGALLIARLLWDILVANLAVARRVLGPKSALRPRFVRMRVELENEFAIAILANTISLTPGTVSVEVSADHRTLTIHCLDVPDPDMLIGNIKRRYEQPLREIFQC